MYEKELYRLSKRKRLSLMASKFTDAVKGLNGVEKVVLFGSVGTDKFNPKYLDIAVCISNYEYIPKIALVARRLTS